MRGAAELLHRGRVRALQREIDRLPVRSRRAMLEGLGEEPIIAGAYSVGPAKCPGFVAYRRGARTGYSDFARAWDRYARGRGIRRARDEDLVTLAAMLRASLAAEPDEPVPAPEPARTRSLPATSVPGDPAPAGRESRPISRTPA